MRRARWFALFVAIFALAVPPAAANAATPSMSIVMRNLNNPRGLNFGANGALYVAEAGRGGEQRCFAGPEGGPEFAGRTGSISRLKNGHQKRIVTGLASHAGTGGFGALGPHDVLPDKGGRLTLTVGLGTNPANRSQCMPIGSDFGWLVRARDNGDWRNWVDLAAFEAANNPDGSLLPDSNPYGLLAETSTARDDGDDENEGENGNNGSEERGRGGTVIATDAGGNSLLAINGNSITTLATFPSRSSGRFTDAVPTSVARGPDGALYVGELSGAPFVAGNARVYRVANGTATPLPIPFSFITDITFGADGSLYVLEFATGSSSYPYGLTGPGNLWRLKPATATGTKTLVATGFVTPTSVTIGRDGAFYISNCGVFPAGNRADDPPPCQAGGGGHVLRVKV
jgi:hypothetical protein